jgi:hypothetical protein
MRSDIKAKLAYMEKGLDLEPDPTLTIEERLILVLHKVLNALAGTKDG